MNKYKEEVNALILSIESPLNENLYYIQESLKNTPYQLIIEFRGNAINRKYDTIISYLLIFYNYINLKKVNEPLFEAIIRFTDILQQKTIIEENKYEIIFVSYHFVDIPNSKVLKYPNEECEITQEINEYIQEDVQEQVKIIQGKQHGTYPDIDIQSLNRVVLGGTFDHLHNGHKILLSAALLLTFPNNVDTFLGLTSSDLLKNKKNKELLQSFEARKERIQYFQQVFSPQTKFFIFELVEPMGPLKDQEFDGLVISQETLQSALGINKYRKEEQKIAELPLYIINIISDSKSKSGNDFSEKASSTTTRNYLLDKNRLTCQQFAELYQSWISLFPNYSQSSHVLDKWFDNLKIKYSEAQRYYHTLSHIHCMLQLYRLIEKDIEYKVEVQLAIWFHDVIYNPRRKDNEKRSAEYYLEFDNEVKGNNIMSGCAKVIVELILLTANHLNTEEMSEEVKKNNKLKQDLETFLDIDLSVLGSSQLEYDQYSSDIIKEYAHFSPTEIKIGRTHVLNTFLKVDNLFKTQYFRQRRSAQARENIQREISNLQL